jgi:endonuclease/exonuclease/phosphatase family metal-dependent hydrolase
VYVGLSSVLLRVLTWNLMHGRSEPPAGRELLDEFAAALGVWEWQLALLQEVPPWWPSELASRLGLGAGYRRVLTSRNALLPLRRAIAVRRPDLIKSNGGGANATLVRGGALHITEQRTLRLARWPERRWLQAVRLALPGGELWAGNLHASGRSRQEAERARQALLSWAGPRPVLLGGDFNLRELMLPGFDRPAAHGVDYIFASGLEAVGEAEVLDRGALSDHAPLAVGLAVGP